MFSVLFALVFSRGKRSIFYRFSSIRSSASSIYMFSVFIVAFCFVCIYFFFLLFLCARACCISVVLPTPRWRQKRLQAPGFILRKNKQINLNSNDGINTFLRQIRFMQSQLREFGWVNYVHMLLFCFVLFWM